MVAQDRIRLRGLLKETLRLQGFPIVGNKILCRCAHHPGITQTQDRARSGPSENVTFGPNRLVKRKLQRLSPAIGSSERRTLNWARLLTQTGHRRLEGTSPRCIDTTSSASGLERRSNRLARDSSSGSHVARLWWPETEGWWTLGKSCTKECLSRPAQDFGVGNLNVEEEPARGGVSPPRPGAIRR